jgi:hypothetical protein
MYATGREPATGPSTAHPHDVLTSLINKYQAKTNYLYETRPFVIKKYNLTAGKKIPPNSGNHRFTTAFTKAG